MSNLAELKVTVFCDYICPFCYVGYHRLKRLRDEYDLKINWRFVEIHPETSSSGEPIASLQYPSDQWRQMMQGLNRLAQQEDIVMREHDFTTNSQDALLLAEAAKEQGRDKFYRLHENLFSAFFVDGKNIGDREVLRELASNNGISDELVESAWNDQKYRQRLISNYHVARKLEIQAVPSFLFGEHKLTGVASETAMRSAARGPSNHAPVASTSC